MIEHDLDLQHDKPKVRSASNFEPGAERFRQIHEHAMAAVDGSEPMALINENLAEILNPEILEKIIAEGGHPKIYWGETPSESPRLCVAERGRET